MSHETAATVANDDNDNKTLCDRILEDLTKHLGEGEAEGEGRILRIPKTECYLRLHPTTSIFVAWNGVIVLVYDGFPPLLSKIKQGIEVVLKGSLAPENFASKWAKTTLAAVHDDAHELSLLEFQQLKHLCQKYSQQLTKETITTATTFIPIQRISIVQYSCRSLENIINEAHMDLEKTSATTDDDDNNNLEAGATTTSQEEKAITNSVVQEWDDEEDYLKKVNAPGSRIGSYRSTVVDDDTTTTTTTTTTDVAAALDSITTRKNMTCVTFLDDPLPEFLSKALSDFRNELQQQFPNRYVWLQESSRHCTLRSLAPP